MSFRSLPARPSLELDKKAAKQLLRAARSRDAVALTRVATHHPRFRAATDIAPDALRLADTELVVAREYGFASWPRYKHFVEALLADRAERASVLTRAVCGNQLSRGRALLEREPELARFDFYAACACGELGYIEQALAKDATLATRGGGPEGWQPLLYACFSRFWRTDARRAESLLAVVQRLLAHGADPNAHYFVQHGETRHVRTCLFAAAGIANHPQLTRLLLDAGADVDERVSPAVHDFPQEALYHAAEFKDTTCLRLLLEAEPAPARVTVSYCLGRALDQRDEAAAFLFLEHGADPGHVVPWHRQRSHLHKAVLHGKSVQLVEAMLLAGADPNHADDDGISPYRYAVRHGKRDLAALLERRGATTAHVTAEDRALDALLNGGAATPQLEPDAQLLVRSARRNDVAEIERLLAAGADVNAALELPPLHAACYAGHLAAAQRLVAAGASLTQTSAYGGTPLSTCIYGSLDCCDDESGPGTLSAEELPARDYAELCAWLIELGAELPGSIRGGSETVQETLRRYGVADAP